MNAIFFGAKRACHSTLRVTRPWLKQMGLTAARFDMLTAMAGPDRVHDDSACFLEMSLADDLFFRLRSAYGDLAGLSYPWHPDD